jgi:hypothetical protein
MADTKPPVWNIKGRLVIACNCEVGCPCNVNGRPTLGNCEGGWTWWIEAGKYGDVDLSGLHLGLYADWPAAIHEGNGVAIALVDDRANEQQRAALNALVVGGAGGPWAIFRKTFTTLSGPTYVRFDSNFAELPRVKAGDKVEVTTEYIKSPVTGATIHPRIVLPEGLVVKDAALVRSIRFKVNDKVSYDHSGRYAAFAFYEYFGP